MLSGSNLGISIQKKKKKTDYFNIFSHIAHYSRKLMCKYKRKGSISQRYSLKLIAFSFFYQLFLIGRTSIGRMQPRCTYPL